jgi:hypothetical protein
VKEGDTVQVIKDRHRKLMILNHPDGCTKISLIFRGFYLFGLKNQRGKGTASKILKIMLFVVDGMLLI